MIVVFRVDSSEKIGYGHLARCLTLANELKNLGATCYFVSIAYTGSIIKKIVDSGFTLFEIDMLPNKKTTPEIGWEIDQQIHDATELSNRVTDLKPSWVIADSYNINHIWHEKTKSLLNTKLMVIDDLARNRIDCDLVLNQNYGISKESYTTQEDHSCEYLIGTDYALLRPEFGAWRKYSLARRKSVSYPKSILIIMGGTDPENFTEKVLLKLKEITFSTNPIVTIVLGSTAPHIARLKHLTKNLSLRTQILVEVSNLAEIMSNADIAIGAAGTTTWERCCLGLPSIQMATAENQKSNVLTLDYDNIAVAMQDIQHLPTIFEKLISNINILAENSANVCDGNGASRVAKKLMTK